MGFEQPPDIFEVCESDFGEWKHPVTEVTTKFQINVDVRTKLRCGHVAFEQTGPRNISSDEAWDMYLRSWYQFFGHPKVLRVDPDGAWKANKNLERIENEGTFLDIIPGEAHHWISTVEESVKEIKGCMYKLAAAHPEITGTEAFYRAVHAVNGKDIVDGFSSLQWALGRAPDIEGRIYPASGVNLTKKLEEEGDEFEKDLCQKNDCR